MASLEAFCLRLHVLILLWVFFYLPPLCYHFLHLFSIHFLLVIYEINFFLQRWPDVAHYCDGQTWIEEIEWLPKAMHISLVIQK